MIPGYEKALSVFPTFFFLVTFLIVSALYYNRFMSEESDSRAFRYYRDYIIILNSQSSIVSVINGLIIIVLYNDLVVGVTMLLITQALSTYVFVALYMKSHYDALFFMIFSVLAYVFEFLYFMFSGVQFTLAGRTMEGVVAALFWFIVILVALSIATLSLVLYSNRGVPEENVS